MNFEVRVVYFESGFNRFPYNILWFIAGGNEDVNRKPNVLFWGSNSFLIPNRMRVHKRLPDVIHLSEEKRAVQEPRSGMAKIKPPTEIEKRNGYPNEDKPPIDADCRERCRVRQILGRFPSAFLLLQSFDFHSAKRFGSFFA